MFISVDYVHLAHAFHIELRHDTPFHPPRRVGLIYPNHARIELCQGSAPAPPSLITIPPTLPTCLRALRLLRHRFKVEGSPVLGVFGYLEWVLLAFAVAALYVMQVCVNKCGTY